MVPAGPDDPPRMPDILGREIVRHIERDIVALRLTPGAKITEEEVCRRYGVSRSPVREALQILEAHGLVERWPRRGVFVAPITVTRLDEVYACRVPLEGLAAAAVATQASAEAIMGLRAALGRMEAAAAQGRPDDAFAANVEITDGLHANCGNATLRGLLANLDKQALRFRYFCYSRSPDMIALSLASNQALLVALEARNAVTAQAVTEDLIRRSWALVREVLEG